MEGLRAGDRHNPLPHIALSTTALKSAYRNMAFCLVEPLLSCGNYWFRDAGNDGVPDCCTSSLGVAGLHEVCYYGKAVAVQAR
jgi:hypothetical protein